MKKSDGKHSRIRGLENRSRAQPAPEAHDARSRAWLYPLAGVIAVVIVLLIIRPCTRCDTSSDRSRTLSMIRWVERGARATDLEKNAKLEKNRISSRMRRAAAPANEKTKTTVIRSAEKKKIPDFGTKLELIPPPATR